MSPGFVVSVNLSVDVTLIVAYSANLVIADTIQECKPCTYLLTVSTLSMLTLFKSGNLVFAESVNLITADSVNIVIADIVNLVISETIQECQPCY